MLFLLETKLDLSFPDAQFAVDNFKFWRKDRNSHGGGIAVYLRSQIAGDRKPNFEFNSIESIALEVILNNQKFLFLGTYKSPSIKDQIFQDQSCSVLDSVITRYDNLFFLGDLNFDMLNNSKCQVLRDVCDIFDLENLVTQPTCFTANGRPSLLDVILTSCKPLVFKTCNFSCGLSDVHNIVGCQLKTECNQFKKQYLQYRSFKNFNAEDFNKELSEELNMLNTNVDMNTAYDNFSNILVNLSNKHAPIKKKKNRFINQYLS